MPNLEDIQQFNRVLTELGSEPEILAERSEEMEEVTPPEQDLSQDLKNLLDSEQRPEGGAEGRETSEGSLADEIPDFEETAGGAGAEGDVEGAPSGEGEGVLPEIDFESLFGDQEGLDELPEEFQEVGQHAGEEPAEEEEPAGEEPAGDAEEPQEGAEEEDLEFPALEEFAAPGEQMGEEEVTPPEPDTMEAGGEEVPFEEETFQPPEELFEGLDVEELGEELDEEEEQQERQEEAVDEGRAEEELAADQEFTLPDLEMEEAPEEPLMQETPEEARTEAVGEEETFQPPEELFEGLDLEGMELPEAEEPVPGEVSPEEFAIPGLDEAPDQGFEEELPVEEPPEAEEEADAEQAEEPEEEEISLSDELEEMQGIEFAPDEEVIPSAEDFAPPPIEGAEEEEEIPAEGPIPASPEEALGIEAIGEPIGEIGEGAEEEEEAEYPAQQAPDQAFPGEEAPLGEAPAAREYTEQEFAALRETLGSLPLNLKIAIEERIGGGALPEGDQRRLIEMLIEGRSPREIAGAFSQITGTTVELPRRFEKRTGVAFERERQTFLYNFRENIVPILRVFVPAALLLFVLGVAVMQFIVTPVRANRLYSRGYEMLPEGERMYSRAEQLFSTALNIQPMKRWFYRYADRYKELEAFSRAEEKYERMLAMRQFARDEKAVVDYARLKTRLDAHEQAEALLQEKILDEDFMHYEALLAAGDNYLEWASEEPQYYEAAYDHYMRILQGPQGHRDEPWFHLLRYHVRRDNLEQALAVMQRFELEKGRKVDPVIYTELGGYLVSEGQLDHVKSVLTRSMDADAELPATYYHLARFFRAVDDVSNEEDALVLARYYFEQKTGTPGEQRLTYHIDTHTRLGELHYRRENFIRAEESFQKAIDMIEDHQGRGVLPRKPLFGRAYYRRGDIHYYQDRDLDVALDMYRTARANGYENPEMGYKIGYIEYVRESYPDALREFYGIADGYRSNRNVLYALANALFQRSNFSAAEGYYYRLIDMLEDEKNRIPLLRPQEDARHRSLVEHLLKAYNNLGVTLARISASPRDPAKETQALVQFTQSSEYYDMLSRDPDTLERGQTKNLAYLNTRGIIYPQSDFVPQIYLRIPKDPEALYF